MPWIAAVLGAVVSRAFSWLLLLFAWNVSKKLALATGFIVASGALFLTMAGVVKALIVASRAAMPQEMAAVTYFLPPDINIWLASFFSLRLTHFVWRWTQTNLAHYVNGFGGGKGTYF